MEGSGAEQARVRHPRRRRWDRHRRDALDRPVPGAEWRRSATTPLEQPFPPWGTRVVDARILRETASRVTVSWLDPGVPAWFTGTFDRATALPSELRMTAAAHFMRQRYVAYNRSVEIQPPSTSG